MARNMAFSMTWPQLLLQEKDTTRRIGWTSMKYDELIQPVFKGMGLKKGSHVLRAPFHIRCFPTQEPLRKMTDDPEYGQRECAREGFPGLPPETFVTWFCEGHHCTPDETITRIEFTYTRAMTPTVVAEMTTAALVEVSRVKSLAAGKNLSFTYSSIGGAFKNLSGAIRYLAWLNMGNLGLPAEMPDEPFPFPPVAG